MGAAPTIIQAATVTNDCFQSSGVPHPFQVGIITRVEGWVGAPVLCTTEVLFRPERCQQSLFQAAAAGAFVRGLTVL